MNVFLGFLVTAQISPSINIILTPDEGWCNSRGSNIKCCPELVGLLPKKDYIKTLHLKMLEKMKTSCGLFTCMETDTGSDPIGRDSFQIGLWLQMYFEEIFTLHTKGDTSISIDGQYPFLGQGSISG